MDIIAGFD